MIRRSFSFALLTLISVAGCSSTTADGTDVSEGRQTEATPLMALKGREYARCWFDLVGADAQLSCTSTARGQDPLVGANVRVVIDGVGGMAKQLDIEAGGTVVVGSIPVTSFPRRIALQAYLGMDTSHMIGLEGGANWSNEIDVTSAAALPAAGPLVIGQPFDLWPVGTVFAMTRGGGFSLKTHPYTQSIEPYRAGLVGEREMTFTPSLAHFDKKVFYVVAPKAGGPLPATQSLHAITPSESYDKETSLPGPGYWTVTDDGIRAATADEITKTFGGATPTTTGEPTTTTPPPVTKPTGPVDADPSCGGDQQRPCGEGAARSCDAGNRTLSNGLCAACGADGKIACYVDATGLSSSQGLKCNASTRILSNGLCAACGANGQITCYVDPNGANSSPGLKCNTSTRVLSNGLCADCGANGQIACYVDPNGTSSSQGLKCNPSTRILSNGLCADCGANGQIACYVDPNGTSSSQGLQCNDGLRVSSSATCIP